MSPERAFCACSFVLVGMPGTNSGRVLVSWAGKSVELNTLLQLHAYLEWVEWRSTAVSEDGQH